MYYEKIAFTIAALAVVASLSNAQRRNWTTEAREAVNHTFTGDTTLDMDNVNGSNEVIGDSGSTIRVAGEKIMRAADQQALDRARREVVLDINERGGVAQLYVNGPFRGNGNGHSSDYHGFHDHDSDRDYEVTYNFTIHVPRRTALTLRSVNGPIKASDTEGKFDVHSVNGGITMTSIAGSGALNAVNGPMTVSFRQNPQAAIEFKTVNGRIDATFPPGLNADLRLKTLNGGMFTDFDVTALPATPSTATQKNGKFVFRNNRTTTVRAGAGGPELNFQTVNGTISIKKGTE